jgi:superfamily II DNA/RNA helicase
MHFRILGGQDVIAIAPEGAGKTTTLMSYLP